jgi:hypothetical protein
MLQVHTMQNAPLSHTAPTSDQAGPSIPMPEFVVQPGQVGSASQVANLLRPTLRHDAWDPTHMQTEFTHVQPLVTQPAFTPPAFNKKPLQA